MTTVHLDSLNPLNPRFPAIVEHGRTDTRYAHRITYFIDTDDADDAVDKARSALRGSRAARDRAS